MFDDRTGSPIPIYSRLSNDELWSRFGDEFVNLQNHKPDTFLKYTTVFRAMQAYDPRPIAEIDAAYLAGFVKSLSGRSPRTIDLYLAVASSFFTWLRKRKHIIDNPFETFHRQPSEIPLPRPYTVQEVLTAAENCSGDLQAPRDKTLVLFLLYTGARIGEALNCTVNSIDRQGFVTFTNTKGRRPRKVPIPVPLTEVLENYLTWRRGMYPHSQWLFPNQAGNQLTPQPALASVQAYTTKSFRFHRVRHTYITEMVRRTNGNLVLAQKLAGHKDPKTTMRYADISDADLKEVSRVWNPEPAPKFDRIGRRVRSRKFFR